MRYRKKFLGAILLLLIASMGWAQSEPSGYYPFVSSNLDDATKLTVNTVVEGSYHHYWIAGDTAYNYSSDFIWYVKNGKFGTYNEVTGTWVENASAVSQSDGGYTLTLEGTVVNSTNNSSQIWVKWDENSGGNYGYIAVYERSSEGCIETNVIKGFKHRILSPPEVWFAESTLEVCSEQNYTVELHFNNIDTLSYPYTVYYYRPEVDGGSIMDTLVIDKGDLNSSFVYDLVLNLVHDIDVTKDEIYTVTLDELVDSYGAVGKIAPEGSPLQYENIVITILHLPQTRTMYMDDSD